MLTVTLLLVLIAFGVTVAAAMSRAPLWIAVILVTIVLLLGLLPIR
jgi:hypothetical protein